jgi:hypothetical protein
VERERHRVFWSDLWNNFTDWTVHGARDNADTIERDYYSHVAGRSHPFWF